MNTALLLLACAKPAPPPAPAADPPAREFGAALPEAPVTSLPLDPKSPAAQEDAEISGLAWWGDRLLLLPQYPDFDGESVAVYTLNRADVMAAIDSGAALSPTPLAFSVTGSEGLTWFRENLDCFEGFEAVVFSGDDAWLTVETCKQGGIVHADISEAGLTVDPTTLQTIPSNSGISNMAEETLLLDGERLLTMHEANGAIVEAPTGHVFSRALESAGEVRVPSLEYRVTDATSRDEDGRFWVINYFYPKGSLKTPAVDPLALAWGVGTSHQSEKHVERLVELQLSESGVALVERAPVYLVLDEDPRNWEGVVRVEGGWLLVTDKYPGTVLGFVRG